MFFQPCGFLKVISPADGVKNQRFVEWMRRNDTGTTGRGFVGWMVSKSQIDDQASCLAWTSQASWPIRCTKSKGDVDESCSWCSCRAEVWFFKEPLKKGESILLDIGLRSIADLGANLILVWVDFAGNWHWLMIVSDFQLQVSM